MRTIKFRAWDKTKNKMQPVKGLSFDYCREIGIKGDEIGVVFGEPYSDELSIENWRSSGLGVANHGHEIDTCILMQFTGLLDKNGKEIFEGDIILSEDRKEIIQSPCWYSCDAFIEYGYENLGSFQENYSDEHEVSELIKKCEIIGNIYENPDLLK